MSFVEMCVALIVICLLIIGTSDHIFGRERFVILIRAPQPVPYPGTAHHYRYVSENHPNRLEYYHDPALVSLLPLGEFETN